jgi:signal transduction histidine kinase
LGLAVVKTVADAHGGDLALHSETGGGTCIELKLPRVASTETPPLPPAAAREVA